MLLKLLGADPLFRISHNVDCHEPQIERKMGAVEDGPVSGGELLFACRLQALIEAGTEVLAPGRTGALANLVTAADGATYAVRPTRLLQMLKAVLFAAKGAGYGS